VALPKDARRVNDIYDALSGEEPTTRVGRPLPRVQLSRLDGTELELAAAPNRQATVLIFWATWCATSAEDLPALSQFVKTYQDRGVAFYAINVGEQPGEVRRFTAKSPLVSTILLDPGSRASSALRITELPAITIVGADNMVRAILHGSAKDLQNDLAAQLDRLLSEPSNTARRPAEATAPK
jgi:thiol-disulfide isomerase/thioredoxin